MNQQITTALGVISAQSKVDETRLKRRSVDMLPKLLEVMEREKKKLPVTIDG